MKSLVQCMNGTLYTLVQPPTQQYFSSKGHCGDSRASSDYRSGAAAVPENLDWREVDFLDIAIKKQSAKNSYRRTSEDNNRPVS